MAVGTGLEPVHGGFTIVSLASNEGRCQFRSAYQNFGGGCAIRTHEPGSEPGYWFSKPAVSASHPTHRMPQIRKPPESGGRMNALGAFIYAYTPPPVLDEEERLDDNACMQVILNPTNLIPQSQKISKRFPQFLWPRRLMPLAFFFIVLPMVEEGSALAMGKGQHHPRKMKSVEPDTAVLVAAARLTTGANAHKMNNLIQGYVLACACGRERLIDSTKRALTDYLLVLIRVVIQPA